MAEKRRYLVKNGLNYGQRRVEAGEIVDDIPRQSIHWLLRDGHIEVVPREAKDATDE